MKKTNDVLKYKVYQKRRCSKVLRRRKHLHPFIKAKSVNIPHESYVYAPTDLRLIENTEGCLNFFRELRKETSINMRNSHNPFIVVSLKNVINIDYGTISILTALGDDFRDQNINMRIYLPANNECKDFIKESGYLNNSYDANGKKFNKAPKSDLVFFEKGYKKFSQDANEKISSIVKDCVSHLTGEREYLQPIRTIILEICGNSIEWSGTRNKQWLLGVKYDNSKVTMTVTDVGKGILDTLHRKYSKKFFDLLRDDVSILFRAFEKKYGSMSQEENRNKGLPSIKSSFDKKYIENLVVVTNGVVLDFENKNNSKKISSGPKFKGTFYQWEITENCIKNFKEKHGKN